MACLDDVYRKYGETAEAAQLLETELGNILLFCESVDQGLIERTDSKLAKEILDKINRSTLGRLLKSLEKKLGGADSVLNLFREALAERNRLAHSFYREHNFRRNSDRGCSIMLKDLEEIHDKLIAALVAVHAIAGNDLESADDILPTSHVPI